MERKREEKERIKESEFLSPATSLPSNAIINNKKEQDSDASSSSEFGAGAARLLTTSHERGSADASSDTSGRYARILPLGE